MVNIYNYAIQDQCYYGLYVIFSFSNTQGAISDMFSPLMSIWETTLHYGECVQLG